MTVEEVLQNIEKQKEEAGIAFLGNIYLTVEEYRTVTEALEKQTPKRPNKIGYPIDSDTDPLVYGYCPCCNTHRDSSKGFCDKCGQALDWSGTK